MLSLRLYLGVLLWVLLLVLSLINLVGWFECDGCCTFGAYVDDAIAFCLRFVVWVVVCVVVGFPFVVGLRLVLLGWVGLWVVVVILVVVSVLCWVR